MQSMLCGGMILASIMMSVSCSGFRQPVTPAPEVSIGIGNTKKKVSAYKIVPGKIYSIQEILDAGGGPRDQGPYEPVLKVSIFRKGVPVEMPIATGDGKFRKLQPFHQDDLVWFTYRPGF